VNRTLGAIVGLAGLWFAAGNAGADDTHYRGVPIGAHSIGLGGAFAGVADDASAAYFNPAGLSLGGTHGIAGGISTNAWERVDLRRAFDHPVGLATATTKQGRTVPLFVGAALKFGPKDALDQKKFALKEDPLALTDTYRVNGSDRGTWYGLSFSGRLNLKQSMSN
jgi:hypothetical protein